MGRVRKRTKVATLNMQKKMEAPRAHVVCVDLVAPDGHETYYKGIGQ